MHDSDRVKLRFGPYNTPLFRYGDVVMDEVRGEVTIVGLSDAPIPWPIGKRGRQKTFVVYAGLADAVRNEANVTVCHWWGITPQTVSKWRKALGVDRATPGSSALLSEYFTTERKSIMHAARIPKYRDPDRTEKIRQSKLGKPRPKHVVAALVASSIGRPWSAETRKQLDEARVRRHPKNHSPWTAEEDELVKTLSVCRVMELTGRSKNRVEKRRKELGVGRKLR